MAANEVGIREFKNQASAYIERVENGEVITVTRHGKAVARVMPAAMPAGLAKLIAEGKVRWNGRKPELPNPVRPEPGAPLISDIVVQERRRARA